MQMKIASLILILSVICGCLAQAQPRSWNFKDLADEQGQTQKLRDSSGFGFRVSTKTIKEVTTVYARLRDALKHIVEINAELLIVESDDANAFVAMRYERPVICITAPMVILLGDDVDLYAASLSHEVAHLAWRHLETKTKRTTILNAIGMGITLSGTPAAIVSPLGLTAIHAAYSRDEEREADALGIELMIAAQFDPRAAIRFHEKLAEHSADVSSFMSTHPSSDERIRNIKQIIEANKSKR